MAFKERNWPDFEGNGDGRGGDLQRRGGGFTWRGCRFRIGFDSATISLQFLLQNGRDFRHDRATIRPRSGHDRGLGPSSIACRSTGDECPTIPRQNLLDRGLIAV